MENVIVFSAHTDDFVLGAGGTIKKYVTENKKVTAVVFSLGEKSHVWLKDDVIKEMRHKETLDAAKLLKCEVVFLDLADQGVYAEYKKKGANKTLTELLEKKKPTKLFTHSSEDPHPDHRAVHKITMELLKKTKSKTEVYIYSVWNPVSFKTKFPALFVDVAKTFKVKMKALKLFQSQQFHIAYPVFMVVFRAFKDGFKIKKRYAEKFYRLQ